MDAARMLPCSKRRRAMAEALIRGARRQCRSYEPPSERDPGGLGTIDAADERLALAVIAQGIRDALAPSKMGLSMQRDAGALSARHDDGIRFMLGDLGRLDSWAYLAGIDAEWLSEAYVRCAETIPCLALRLRWDPELRV